MNNDNQSAPIRNYQSIQALRAVAAILVAQMHIQFFYADSIPYMGGSKPFMSDFHNFKGFGGSGVQIFFVISGFIMAYLQAKGETDSFGDFMVKRLTRIVPLYWIVTLFWVFVLAGIEHTSIPKLLHSLFFIPTRDNTTIVGPAWTLPYEMFFYVLFGICTLVLRLSFLWVGVAFLIVNLLFTMTGFYIAHLYSDPIIWTFFSGIVIFHIHRLPWIQREAKPLFIVGVVLLLASIFWHMPNPDKGIREFLPWSVPSMLIVLGATALEARGSGAKIFGHKILQIMGEASYSLYLIHLLCFFRVAHIILYDIRVQDFIGPDLTIVVFTVVCCVISIGVNKFIEKPSIRITRKAVEAVRQALHTTVMPGRIS